MKLTLARSGWLALLAALATLATTGPSLAATYTWTGSAANNNWFSTTVPPTLGSNWSTSSVLTSSDTLQFSGTSKLTATQNATTTVTGVVFDSTAGAFNVNTSGNFNLTVTGSIVNQSSNLQTFAQSGANTGQLTFGNGLVIDTGTGGILIDRTSGNTSASVSKTGLGTLTFDRGYSAYTGTLTAQQGEVVINNNFNGTLSVVTGATATLGAASNLTNLATDAGSVLSLADQASFTTGTIAGAVDFGGATNAAVQVNNAVGFASSATIAMQFGLDGTLDSMNVNNDLTYGGTLNLTLTDATGTAANGDTWQFFSFTSQSGDLSGLTLSASAGSPYNGLTFFTATSGNYYDQQYGAGVWLSDWTAGNQRFIFNQADGILTVVPEPSTIVFAGIGAAMLGWHTWTRGRRNARMKLVEEHMRKVGEERGLV